MKNLLSLIGLFVIFVIAVQPLMAQTTIEVPQVQVGTFASSGTNLAAGTGERQLTVSVTFPKPFKVKPDVVAGINMIDAGGHIRVSVSVEGVTREGCNIVIKTWADSKIGSVQGSWVAVAPTTVKVK